ncbi:MAG: oligopeptide transporter subunit [Verrucomicrobiota bacterium]|jgi:ABC-type dipeptide/oligopeptide/nickel transport system permease component
MLAFLTRRLLAMAGVLLCVISLTFLLVRLSPGGPFARERKLPPAIEKELLARYQLDGSLWQQYSSYLGDVLQGDLRLSTKYRDRSVNELLAQSLPISALLGTGALLVAVFFGVWLGAIAAVRQGSAADTAAMLAALALISIPTFVTGPLLVLIFSLKLGWLPVGGLNSPSSLLLPILTLAGPAIASIARLTRTSLLEVLQSPFLRTARAKGLSESRILYIHALKTGLLPVVSYLGPLAAHLLTGSIVVETLFNLPGAGSFFVNAILNRDVFLLGGVVIVYCTLLVTLNLLVDLAYTWLDPRIRLEN